MPRRRLGTDGRKSWHQLCIGCIVACWSRASCSGLSKEPSSGRNVAVCGGCQLRWTGMVDRTRAARLKHSLHREDGGKGTITNHREANAKGKPNMADTAAPNKLEPRIDSGTCRPAPGIARTARPPSASSE